MRISCTFLPFASDEKQKNKQKNTAIAPVKLCVLTRYSPVSPLRDFPAQFDSMENWTLNRLFVGQQLSETQSTTFQWDTTSE